MVRQYKPVLAVLVMMVLFGMPAADAADVVDRIVAIVNEEIITLVELKKASAVYRKNIEASGKSDAQKKEMIQAMEADILSKMIDRSLASQEAVKNNITVRDEDVESAIENFKQANNVDDQGLKKGLEAEGVSYEEYRARVKEDILQTMLVNRAVRSKVIVTESDIKAYYDTHPEEFEGKKTYRLRNILADSEDRINQAVKDLENNISFKEVAQQYSIASNAVDGGDLGEFDISNFSDAIKDAVTPLKQGQYSKVIRTGQGFQILYVEKITGQESTAFEQAHDKIEDILYRKQASEKFEKWIKSLKEKAHIKVML